MTVTEKLNQVYLRKLVSTPAGRAHVLAQTADGESSGEARIFKEVLARAHDPELGRLVTRHRDDELRHERLFRERLAATGVAEPELPESLRFVEQLNRALGGILDRPIQDDRGVLEAYCLLQVLEERAVFSFGKFIDAFREADPATAQVFAEVLEDERRHLKYCAAVAKRYATGEEERLEVLSRIRAVEARVFQENQLRNMNHTLSRGFMGGQTLAWRLLQRLVRLVEAAGLHLPAAAQPA
jgi:rubrerythrin